MPLPDLVPVEALLGSPERTAATISPDGAKIAYLAPWKDRRNIWVRELDPGAEARCVTTEEIRGVAHYEWADDPRWLIYIQDGRGAADRHLFRVDLDAPGTRAVDLTPFPGARVLRLDQPVGRPGTVVLELDVRKAGEVDLYELDLPSGELTLLVENPGGADGWMYAGHGDPVAHTLTDDGDIVLSRYDVGSGALHPFVVFDGADHPLSVLPVQLTPDATAVWVGSNRDTDRTRLVRIDVAGGTETEVDSHAEFDLDVRRRGLTELPSPLIRDRRTGELIGVRYLGERQVIQAATPQFAAVLEQLEALSDGDLGAISSDESGERWVVDFVHDRDPGATWFYDHATGERRRLFGSSPTLVPEMLAPMSPVTITARDGLSLPSYLTLPVGVEPAGLPMVLLVHGGPWCRDTWGYRPVVQLLANRGYAVLQVNFRGSIGYGKAHVQAATREFAGRMHDDLIDAVEWAVGQGYADRDQVGILGESYGGYAALVGVAFTPDVFAAAVDVGGISDLAAFVRNLSPFPGEVPASSWFRYVGNPDVPEQEADMLARSPITRVDRIRAPLMIARGAADVHAGQADDIVAALRARGADVDVVGDDAGNGLVDPEHRLDLHRAVERFFGRHLGGRRAGW